MREGDEEEGVEVVEVEDEEGGPARPCATPETVVPDVGADLPGYTLTQADKLLDVVYGDHIHDNDGTHLDGGVADDGVWQARWRRLVQVHPNNYSVPKGRVGSRFLTRLAAEFRGVRERKWNSERVVVFLLVVLRRTAIVKRARDVRRRVEMRLDLWEQGCHSALVDDTEAEAKGGAKRTSRDRAAAAKAFHAKVMAGRLRSAVRGLTDREGGGVRQPDDLCSKAGRPVHEVLTEKHPPLRDPVVGEVNGAFEPHDTVPQPIPTVVGEDTVLKVAAELSGGGGLTGTDGVDLKGWLVNFGVESQALREEMAAWVMWLGNTAPPVGRLSGADGDAPCRPRQGARYTAGGDRGDLPPAVGEDHHRGVGGEGNGGLRRPQPVRRPTGRNRRGDPRRAGCWGPGAGVGRSHGAGLTFRPRDPRGDRGKCGGGERDGDNGQRGGG